MKIYLTKNIIKNIEFINYIIITDDLKSPIWFNINN